MICLKIAYQMCEKTLIDSFVDKYRINNLDKIYFRSDSFCYTFFDTFAFTYSDFTK